MGFQRSWTAKILARPPMIAPARQFTYPMQIAGEEDALARGALRLSVKPAEGGSFLATCALGFTSPSMPTGVYGSPNPDELCAAAGGYAYIVDTLAPGTCTLVGLKPVVSVIESEANGLLLFVGFHAIHAWGREGPAWQTARLSWEGISVIELTLTELVGFGWNLKTDREMEFRVDLQTGSHTGGAFQTDSSALGA